MVNPIGRRARKGGYTRITGRFELPRIKGAAAVHWRSLVTRWPVLLCCALLQPAMAQGFIRTALQVPSAYPSRPIRFIVGFAPGGATRVNTRLSVASGRVTQI